jgi:ParB family chromosome partitioning protein
MEMKITTYEKGKLYQLDLARLQADPNQPRKYMDSPAMEEMTASVAKHGILQPILFRVDEAGNPIIVAGERRVEAARKAGIDVVPAIAVEGNASEIALVENLLRQDLTTIEEAEALQRLLEEQKYNHEQLAGVIGKARSTITEILTLNRLPQDIRDKSRGDRKISRTTLLEIARKKQVRGMETAYEKYQEKLKKQEEGRQKREKVDQTAGDICQWLGKTNDKLGALDTSAWTDDEKTAFTEVLTSIQGTIQTLLNPPPAKAAPASKTRKK